MRSIATTQSPKTSHKGRFIRLPDRKFKSEPKLDSEFRITIMVVSVDRNHWGIAIHLAVINPASMTPIMVICSFIMIKCANIMAELSTTSS